MRVAGSAAAIAATQRSSVHFFQRPDGEERYDSTRTSMQGGVVSVGLQKIGGQVRFSTNARYASTGMEANDLGFVILVNDMSVRNQLTVQSLRPSRFYRRVSGYVSNETHWTTGGTQNGASVTLSGNTELKNFWTSGVTVTTFDIGGARCVACARGGPALRQSPERLASFSIAGDGRKSLVPSLAVSYGRGDDGNSSGARSVGG